MKNYTGKSNWNKLATWYDSLVGPEGHKYHQQYAIPTTMDLLDIKERATVLDIGCGQGILASAVKKAGGLYMGVDSSELMVKSAIARHGKDGRFIVHNANKLSEAPSLKDLKFDNVTFVLSIQDMAPLDAVVREACKLLRENGKFILFILHPAYRIPRQSGWGEDKKRKLTYRRIDRYLTEEVIPLETNVKENGKQIRSYFYHRPIGTYFSELAKNNIVVEKLIEIPDDSKGLYAEFPLFLAIQGRKTVLPKN